MRKTVSILSLLLVTFSLAAQQQEEIIRFQHVAGQGSTLFRGEQAERYLFPANGNPYWESAEFSVGNIRIRGRDYYDISLNVDAVAQLALVQVPGSQSAVSVSPAALDYMETGDRLFVGVTDNGKIPDGIYEVFGRGPEHVYKSVRKHLSYSTNNVNGSAIGYRDAHYRDDVTRYFEISVKYYFLDADGNFSRIRGKGALMNKFPERRKALRKAIRGAGLDYADVPFDKYCKSLLKFAQQ